MISDLLVCWSVDLKVGQAFGDVVSEIVPSQRMLFGATHSILSPIRREPLQVMSLSDVIHLTEARVEV